MRGTHKGQNQRKVTGEATVAWGRNGGSAWECGGGELSDRGTRRSRGRGPHRSPLSIKFLAGATFLLMLVTSVLSSLSLPLKLVLT